MAHTLALQFLSVVLLLLMNGHDTRARDIKVELPDQKQVDNWYRAKPVSNDESYGGGYISISEDTKPIYQASYTATKHNHHQEMHNHPCRTSDAHKSNQPNYAAAYDTKAHDSNAPYIAGYKTTHITVSPNYIAAYDTKAHDSNTPYIAAYKTTHKTVSPNYIAAYETKAHDSNTPYIAAYKTTHKTVSPNYIAAYETKAHDLNTPYIAGYKTTHKTVSPNYIAAYETKAHDSNTPYIAGYKTNSAKKAPKESSHDDTIKPYITQYGDTNPKNNPTESSHDDTTKPYNSKNGGTGPKNNPKQSSNIDHTEAFKTGFFALDDLYVGNVMTLQFPIQEVSHFLQRKEAESIPFSTSQLSSVLQLFSIPEDSPEANAMRDTLGQCEAEPITGETKICATSLESMLEFVGTIIGSEAKHNILTTSYPTPSSVPLQKYTILEVSEDINAHKWVACHPLPYPYATYYCHFIATGSKVFKVSLGGENDNKIEALGICHLDTSDWNPNHIIFRQLGITPGKDPVCHFFPVNHLMWIPQPSQATM